MSKQVSISQDVIGDDPSFISPTRSSVSLSSGFSVDTAPSSVHRLPSCTEAARNSEDPVGSRSPFPFLSTSLRHPSTGMSSTVPECDRHRPVSLITQRQSQQTWAPSTVPLGPSSARAENFLKLPTAVARTRDGRRGGKGSISKRRPSSKPPNGSSGGRGNGFSQAEVDSFLELLEEQQPLGRDEWEHVARLHEQRYPRQDRNIDSLRRKFDALCRKSAPTRDPTILPDVLWAKKIRKMMTERADLGDGDELEGDDFEESHETMDLTFNSRATMTDPGLQETGEHDNGNGGEASRTDPDQSLLDPKRVELSSSNRTGLSPRPLVRKKDPYNRNGKKQDDDGDLMTPFKLSLMQEQSRREEERRLRMMDREDENRRLAEDRRVMELRWGEEKAIRQEERERRDEERRRSDS